MATPFIDADLKALVIGHPIGHSLSPVMQNRWLADAGIGGRYGALDVPPEALPEALQAIRNSAVAGFNVTIPHKERIVPLLDKLAPMARRLGAVNTVKRADDGSLIGFNTDGIGWLAHLRATAPHWRSDLPVLVLGAGGAARAIVAALLTTSVPVVMLANRSRARADALVHDLGQGRVVALDWSDRHDPLGTIGLLVNTTSLGMTGQPELPLSLERLDRQAVVNDIVYKPLLTDLLAGAKSRGNSVVGGLGMLVEQGAAAFKIWFGDDAAPDTSPAFISELAEQLL